MMAERKFPSICPHCTGLLSVSGSAHCADLRCGWLNCQCGAMINEAGRHTHATRRRSNWVFTHGGRDLPCRVA